MAGHTLLEIYKGIEHEDSTEHVQWIDTIGHESLETVEKKGFFGEPQNLP